MLEVDKDLLKEVVLSGVISEKNDFYFQRKAIIMTLFLQTGQMMSEDEIDNLFYSGLRDETASKHS